MSVPTVSVRRTATPAVEYFMNLATRESATITAAMASRERVYEIHTAPRFTTAAAIRPDSPRSPGEEVGDRQEQQLRHEVVGACDGLSCHHGRHVLRARVDVQMESLVQDEENGGAGIDDHQHAHELEDLLQRRAAARCP